MSDVLERLKTLNYHISKSNSKTVWVKCDDRIRELDFMQHHFKYDDFYYDEDNSASSFGAVFINGTRVVLKSNKRDNPLACEDQAIQKLVYEINQIAMIQSDIRIVLDNGKTITNPNDVIKPSGNPKSDFYISNAEGDSLHISHKKGSKAKDFQQYSGMTSLSIQSNQYAQSFQDEMKKRFQNAMPNRMSVAMKIPDDEEGVKLKTIAVYGDDALSPISNGVNKVDCLLQGTPTLERLDNVHFRLSTKENIVYNYPMIPRGDSEPVMSLIYKGDRSNFGIEGARASIYPIGGRTWKQFLL